MAALGTGIGNGSVASRPGMSAAVKRRMDAGHGERRRGVDRADAGMGMGAANKRRMKRARQLHVVDEARPPGEQSGVFDPRHAGAELSRAHGLSPHAPACGGIGSKAGGQGGIHREFWARHGRKAPCWTLSSGPSSTVAG